MDPVQLHLRYQSEVPPPPLPPDILASLVEVAALIVIHVEGEEGKEGSADDE